MKYNFYTSKPFGDILRYSLTSLLFNITFMFSMSMVVYEYGRSGIKTRKEISVSYRLFFLVALNIQKLWCKTIEYITHIGYLSTIVSRI